MWWGGVKVCVLIGGVLVWVCVCLGVCVSVEGCWFGGIPALTEAVHPRGSPVLKAW